MSTLANPDKAYAWQDGDAFRAPKGTAMPAVPFSNTPTTGTGPGVVWSPYGGIEAGFETSPKQDLKKHPVFNKRQRPYKVTKGPRENSMKLRAVDYSAAAVLTTISGGSIAETSVGSGIFVWTPGDDEHFAFMVTLNDGNGANASDRIGFYCADSTLAAPPPRKFSGEDLDGFELELEFVSELVPFSNFNPLAP